VTSVSRCWDVKKSQVIILGLILMTYFLEKATNYCAEHFHYFFFFFKSSLPPAEY